MCVKWESLLFGVIVFEQCEVWSDILLIHVSADDSIGIGKEPWVSER